MISTFFIGLGAIGDSVRKALNPNSLEWETQRVKVIRVSQTEKQAQIQMMLPKIEEPIVHKKVILLRQSEIID